MLTTPDVRYSTANVGKSEAARSCIWENPVLQLLHEKLTKEEAAVAPRALFDVDYSGWYRLWQGIYVMQFELDLPEGEQTIRMLVEKRPDDNNVVSPHMLAAHLVKIGKYAEAEETERPVLAWMDEKKHLGRESPQAINARRTIAQAQWKQGPSRWAEAEALLAEIHEIINGMGDGQFGV